MNMIVNCTHTTQVRHRVRRIVSTIPSIMLFKVGLSQVMIATMVIAAVRVSAHPANPSFALIFRVAVGLLQFCDVCLRNFQSLSVRLLLLLIRNACWTIPLSLKLFLSTDKGSTLTFLWVVGAPTFAFSPVSFPHQYQLYPLYSASFLSPGFGGGHVFGWSLLVPPLFVFVDPPFALLACFLPVLFFDISKVTFLFRDFMDDVNFASNATIFSSAVGAFQVPFSIIAPYLFLAAIIKSSGVSGFPS